jgi:hypothetical protein
MPYKDLEARRAYAREATRRYREKHAERLKAEAEQIKASGEKREYWRERTRKWRASNPEKVKELQRKDDLKRYHSSKDEAFELLGNKCTKCGWTDRRALQIDHIEAIGDAKRRELNHRGRILYREVKADPTKYQILCANCNWIKRAENNELKFKSDTRSTTSALETGAGTKG